MNNLFNEIPAELPQELIQVLLENENLRIERIVSRGHETPADFWYDQEEHEWIAVLAGAARVRFEEHVEEMQPGSFLFIPAHTRHRVEWTHPTETTIWLAVFF